MCKNFLWYLKKFVFKRILFNFTYQSQNNMPVPLFLLRKKKENGENDKKNEQSKLWR